MGTSSSGGELAGKLAALARDVADSGRQLNAVGLAGKGIFRASAEAAGASRLARARYDLRGSDAVVVRYAGAKAHLVNNPTRPHRIEPRSRRRGGRRRGLSIGGEVRAYANHPGTKGKGFFQVARAASEAALPRVWAREVLTNPLRRIF